MNDPMQLFSKVEEKHSIIQILAYDVLFLYLNHGFPAELLV